MCLAIPSKVIKIADGIGTIDADGVKRTCSLLLVDDVQVGDYVIVHAGFALRKVDEAAAMETISFLKEAAAAADEAAKKDSR
jgi:hydrogenase expression/formation protein HypC